MKKLTFLLVFISASLLSNAQVKFLINGCNEYDMTWADEDFWSGPGGTQTWGTPNMLLTSNAVSSQLVLVQGIDPVVSGNCTFDKACNGGSAITNSAMLAGKIAVIRRGSCEFGSKALAAQNAGAIACIIVNANSGPIDMNGGTDGMLVTIPTIMVGFTTGDAICDAINNGTANGFIGNINGYYANNLSLNSSEMYIPKRATDVAKVYNATNSTGIDHDFAPGVLVRNLGTNNQTNVQVQCKIGINSTILYTQVSTLFNLNAGDSLWVDFPVFTNTTETDVTFSGQYSIISGQTDDLPCDINIPFKFSIKPNQFSYANLDPNTGNSNANGLVNGGIGLTTEFKLCDHLYDANASLLYPESISFRALTYDPVNSTSLTGKTVDVELYEWQATNGVYDMNDPLFDPQPTNNTYTLLTNGSFFYAADYQDSLITVSFDSLVLLNDNTHYFFCTSYYGNDQSFSFRTDNSTDYSYNFANPLSTGYPTTSTFIDGNFYAAGFGFYNPSSMVVNFSDCFLGSYVDSITSCSPITWVDGNVYNQSTNTPTYTYVGGGANGCDSIVTLNLTINGPTPTVIVSGDSIISTANNAISYQWINCDSNNAQIPGETSYTFTPSSTGNYAVVVTNSNCTDTSSCISFIYGGLTEELNTVYNLYPNPTNESFYINSAFNSQLDVSIINIQGKTVYHNIINTNSPIDVTKLNRGVYFVQIKTSSTYKTIKLIVE